MLGKTGMFACLGTRSGIMGRCSGMPVDTGVMLSVGYAMLVDAGGSGGTSAAATAVAAVTAGCSFKCFFLCLLRLLEQRNRAGQCWHLNGFSPV